MKPIPEIIEEIAIIKLSEVLAEQAVGLSMTAENLKKAAFSRRVEMLPTIEVYLHNIQDLQKELKERINRYLDFDPDTVPLTDIPG